MNLIKRVFDLQRPNFTSGGRFERLYPFFEAMETVFFVPGRKTAAGPHLRDSLDVKRFMTLVIVALMPCLGFGIYNAGYQSHLASGLSLHWLDVVSRGLRLVMPMVVVTYGVGFFWEIVFASVRKHAISEGLFVSCMLFPLTLPPTTPLWQVALGISFGIVIGKEIFGGTGRNFLNPALAGRAFLYFAYPVQMSGDAVWTALAAGRQVPVDAFTGATPLAISAGVAAPGHVVSALTDGGYTVTRLFFGLYPGSVGATSVLLCIAGAIFLVVVGVASYRIILGGVLGLLATGFLVNWISGPASMPYLALNPVYHLVMGGFAFALVFMATEPVSAPDLDGPRWVYGFAIGALTVMIRVFNPAFPEGVMLAILFMNLFAPLMDHIAVGNRLRKRIPNV
ncbi:MAG: NADH:ubiquinone reductase (Na(+)-transporting) subunit B [Desulfobacterales bacterium]|nr:NADH:ubiquinone reductase (Na(+)-transporting) subunit B [Desulfobacterales bacterium]